ncbi:hypothetical protein TELCIR_14557 [Teladorsagia circumcincta]|uniref:Uncharacterized protein n=1 Tax=Teladorsagia circumcincta TaxID=45464 RepID=A0A2G9U2U3_TELCI|nr:hypothetical protein TELCIR_14557 [Teladorsagia circumcincta]
MDLYSTMMNRAAHHYITSAAFGSPNRRGIVLVGQKCYDTPKNRCMECPDCPDLCANATSPAAKSECRLLWSSISTANLAGKSRVDLPKVKKVVNASQYSLECRLNRSGLKTVYEPGVHMISMACGAANVLVAFIWLQETKNCSLDTAGRKAEVPADAKADAKEMETLLPKAGDAAATADGTSTSKDDGEAKH